ncbi:MAG: O-antigen ligase domain-containing protein [Deltaproteobacteria bacterium]|nr:O-antigen ligase domain-containing protein [Deltaproteobacteria bacterium]
MGILALLPFPVAAYYAFARSPQYAFLRVYLPVMLLLPEYYRWIAPGLPDPTFSQAAILPIFLAFLLKDAKRWRFSGADLLVFGYAFCVGYSEYVNSGYSEAQNLIFNMFTWVLCPYILAKGLIEPHGLRIELAKRLVFPLFLVSVISLYEFRFGSTPWRIILDRFFPGQAVGWVTTFRWGLARIAGPYGHAILAGIMLVIGYRLQRWLQWNKAWEPHFKHLPSLPLSKAQVLTVGLLGGVIMTLCKGPWGGAVLGAGLAAIGRVKNRKLAVNLLIAGILLIGIPAFIGLWSWASVGREYAKTVSQETAAYRKELIDHYVDIALAKSWWGWGLTKWPKVPGMPSIDNYYLLLALMHGLLALGLFVALQFYMAVRLYWRGWHTPPPPLSGSSLAFTLLGIYAAFGFSVATVYMGNQVIPLFFLITGWAEGYLQFGREAVAVTQTVTHSQQLNGRVVPRHAVQPSFTGFVSYGRRSPLLDGLPPHRTAMRRTPLGSAHFRFRRILS